MGFVAYLEDTYNELVNKVSWPTWKDLQSSAIVVLVASLCFALVVWLMDFVFGIHAGGDVLFGWRGVLGFFYSMFN